MNATYNHDSDFSLGIKAAAARVRNGGLVAFPTETVYGLGADALRDESVARVFAIKGRPSHNPLIVHVHSAEEAQRITSHWPDNATKLARAFWPGPLTLVLPKASTVPDIVTGGGPNVAVRVPDHPVALALLREFGGPLVGPSANPSGRISPTAAAHVKAYFPPQEVMVLDGGACRSGIESTVVLLAENDKKNGHVSPTILRPGVITAAEIAAVLNISERDVILHSGYGETSRVSLQSGALPGPGMLAQHYAPRTPASLCDITQIRAALSLASPRTVVVTWSMPPGFVSQRHTIIGIPCQPAAYAANMYAALMRADASGAEKILIEKPDTSDGNAVWAAVMDRLVRATSA